MKKSIALLGILLTILLAGCSNDSSSHSKVLDGQWKLVHVGGSFGGVSNDFNPGIITWTFNPTTQTMTVVNNNTDDNLTDIFETGVYNYQIVDSENPDLCSEVLKIDNVEMGCFSVVNDSLHIDQSFLDGYLVTLIH